MSDLPSIAGSAALFLQATLPSRDAADARVEEYTKNSLATLDANNFLYQVSASEDFDPSEHLEDIVAPMMWISSADDFVNPPDLGITEVAAKRLRHGRFILIPTSAQTRGHGSHSWAALWKGDLAASLEASRRAPRLRRWCPPRVQAVVRR